MPDTHADRLSTADALEQIRELRTQVESLVRDRVGPMVTQAADRATAAARDASGFVREEAEAVAGRVRDRPLTWIIGAAVAGYLLGRVTR
jgi:ElaB/YqjD/DUF883 family membrane-anchored ribosome-binding protein